MKAGQLVPQRLADPVGRLQERAGDEFDGGGGHVLRKHLGDWTPGRAGQSELIGLGAHRLR